MYSNFITNKQYVSIEYNSHIILICGLSYQKGEDSIEIKVKTTNKKK